MTIEHQQRRKDALNFSLLGQDMSRFNRQIRTISLCVAHYLYTVPRPRLLDISLHLSQRHQLTQSKLTPRAKQSKSQA
jgi:hypothetical protein